MHITVWDCVQTAQMAQHSSNAETVLVESCAAQCISFYFTKIFHFTELRCVRLSIRHWLELTCPSHGMVVSLKQQPSKASGSSSTLFTPLTSVLSVQSIYLLFPTHTLFFPIISCVFPMFPWHYSHRTLCFLLEIMLKLLNSISMCNIVQTVGSLWKIYINEVLLTKTECGRSCCGSWWRSVNQVSYKQKLKLLGEGRHNELGGSGGSWGWDKGGHW